MSFVPMGELLDAALAGGYAVPSFCAWNAESMIAVLSVATDMRTPVILMDGPAEFTLIPVAQMGAIAQTIVRRFALPVALHVDHGDSLELIREGIEAGYTSVMLDRSQCPFEENVSQMRRGGEGIVAPSQQHSPIPPFLDILPTVATDHQASENERTES